MMNDSRGGTEGLEGWHENAVGDTKEETLAEQKTDKELSCDLEPERSVGFHQRPTCRAGTWFRSNKESLMEPAQQRKHLRSINPAGGIVLVIGFGNFK